MASPDNIVLNLTRRPPKKLRSKIAHWAINQSSMQPLNFWPSKDDPDALYKKTKSTNFKFKFIQWRLNGGSLRFSKIIECIVQSLSQLGIVQGLLASVSATLLGFGCFYDSRLSPTATDADTYTVNRKNLYIAQTCLTLAVGIQVLISGCSTFIQTALIPASKGLFSPYCPYSDHPSRMRAYLSVTTIGVQAGFFLFGIGSYFLVIEFMIPGQGGGWGTATTLAILMGLLTFMPDWYILVEEA
ncbi:hypothetical protein FRB98_002644 [Tulasnella sp. 332]|nr:hypothetical protein FRB98_002644 [Tulasnella sp. 332]